MPIDSGSVSIHNVTSIDIEKVNIENRGQFAWRRIKLTRFNSEIVYIELYGDTPDCLKINEITD